MGIEVRSTSLERSPRGFVLPFIGKTAAAVAVAALRGVRPRLRSLDVLHGVHEMIEGGFVERLALLRLTHDDVDREVGDALARDVNDHASPDRTPEGLDPVVCTLCTARRTNRGAELHVQLRVFVPALASGAVHLDEQLKRMRQDILRDLLDSTTGEAVAIVVGQRWELLALALRDGERDANDGCGLLGVLNGAMHPLHGKRGRVWVDVKVGVVVLYSVRRVLCRQDGVLAHKFVEGRPVRLFLAGMLVGVNQLR
mmetsp:Transcript_10864/g.29071  ORF Transcript_10864/g.29071 Transcript_10864/m.29071 type:complete len:255 (-) Transcript_10864:649-1413(-)